MLLRPRRPQLRKTVDWDLGHRRLNVAELAAMSRTAGKNCRAAAEETRSRGMWAAGKGGAEAGMRRGEVNRACDGSVGEEEEGRGGERSGR